jgi:uncharacterized protein YkwD
MGKAVIKENLKNGLYRIELDRNKNFIQKEIEKIEKRIEEINKRIAKEEKEIDTATKKILEKRKDQFEKLLLESKTPLAWCCDMSPNLSGTVETIEIDGEPRKINIAPKNPGFNKIPSGDLTPVTAMSPAQAALNFALHPGWQKFKPTYRLGAITKIENGFCDIEIIDTESFYQEININQTTVYKDVPVKYMTCDSGAFWIDDVVVIEFEDQNFEKPVIIGFYENPEQCDAYILVSNASGSEAVLWDAFTDSVLFEKDTKENILEKSKENGFGIPLKCLGDGFKKFNEVPFHTTDDTNTIGLNYLVYPGLLGTIDLDFKDYIYAHDKYKINLSIQSKAFGLTTADHRLWADGDSIIFQTYAYSNAVDILSVNSDQGVFYEEYVNKDFTEELGVFGEKLSETWTLHLWKGFGAQSTDKTYFYVESASHGIYEETLYNKNLNWYPLSSDMKVFPKTSDIKIKNTSNYIFFDNKNYFPVPCFMLKYSESYNEKLKELIEADIDISIVLPNYESLYRKRLYYFPLFTWEFEKIELTPYFMLFDAIEQTPVFDMWQIESDTYEVGTGKKIIEKNFEYKVGQAVKNDFSLIYDGYNYKDQKESFFHVSFPARKYLNTLEFGIFNGINEYRKKQGLSEMVLNINLTIAARRHAEDIKAHTSHFAEGQPMEYYHIGTDGSTFDDRMKDSGYLGYYTVYSSGYKTGENIGFRMQPDGKYIPDTFIDGWVNSPPHLANIIEPKYIETGIASVIADDGLCAIVQTFGFCGGRPAGISPLVKLSEYIKNNFTWAGEENFIPEVYLV